MNHKAKKEDKIKIIHCTEFDDFNHGDILIVNDTWYGGVWAKDGAGVSVAVNEEAYEVFEEAECNKVAEYNKMAECNKAAECNKVAECNKAAEYNKAPECNKAVEKVKPDAVVMDKYTIMHGKEWMQPDNIKNLLGKTYWAKTRSMETIRKSIENSLCYGAFCNDNGEQIGFARVLTDYATTYYLCDVVVAETYRGCGIGKGLLTAIQENEELSSLRGILATQDAHELYKKFGFANEGETFMGKPGKKED